MNITASAEFDLIKNTVLREQIVDAYNTNETTLKDGAILRDFVQNQITPFLWKNVNYSDSRTFQYDYETNPLFENLVSAYRFLLAQQIRGYEENLDIINMLDDNLRKAVGNY